MLVSNRLCYNTKNEKIVGPHSAVQIVMASGIMGKWKQPIFYGFVTPMTANFLKELIKQIGASGYAVMSVTSDLAGSNNSMWKELKINATHSYFPNPCDEHSSLLKRAKNRFRHQGFESASSEIIQKFCIEFKISQQHLDVSRIKRKLLSNTTSKVLEYLGGNLKQACIQIKQTGTKRDFVRNERTHVLSTCDGPQELNTIPVKNSCCKHFLRNFLHYLKEKYGITCLLTNK
ncbi:hypothetical protein PR048_017115 [Dryococelus australis]|uniref:Transposable element P transposase-like RNase H domain-containing protein n=1 Tax=Dryococelus australis TaxID=614101 RepID=A0ABQ9H8U3_9NEOP|nr:hypothetical protein PR048_017115 [Dryococelus australis]